MIATSDRPAQGADQFEITLIWMEEAPLYPGRFLIKLATQTIRAIITR